MTKSLDRDEDSGEKWLDGPHIIGIGTDWFKVKVANFLFFSWESWSLEKIRSEFCCCIELRQLPVGDMLASHTDILMAHHAISLWLVITADQHLTYANASKISSENHRCRSWDGHLAIFINCHNWHIKCPSVLVKLSGMTNYKVTSVDLLKLNTLRGTKTAFWQYHEHSITFTWKFPHIPLPSGAESPWSKRNVWK